MQTSYFGKPGWTFIHCIANNYANLDWDSLEKNGTANDVRRHYKKFFYYLGMVLPCKYCRQSYKKFYNELPIERFLYGRDDLLYWTYCIHNKVNDKLRAQCEYNKPNPSFTSILKKYKAHNAKSCAKKKSIQCNSQYAYTTKPYQSIKYCSKS